MEATKAKPDNERPDTTLGTPKEASTTRHQKQSATQSHDEENPNPRGTKKEDAPVPQLQSKDDETKPSEGHGH